MLPLDVARSPESRLMSVVLPAPFGPTTACSFPRPSSTATPFTAARPPKRRVSPVVRRIASLIGRLADERAPEAPGDAGEAAGKEDDQQDDRRAEQQLPVRGERLEDLGQRDEREGA